MALGQARGKDEVRQIHTTGSGTSIKAPTQAVKASSVMVTNNDVANLFWFNQHHDLKDPDSLPIVS